MSLSHCVRFQRQMTTKDFLSEENQVERIRRRRKKEKKTLTLGSFFFLKVYCYKFFIVKQGER